MESILFLCTGNYYRSRLAEEYFNHLAKAKQLSTKAYSRAIQQDLSKTNNKGNISKEVIEILTGLNIPIHTQNRLPISVNTSELTSADLIIALDETEHNPMIKSTFPQFSEKVTYFNIGDIHIEPVYVASTKLIKKIDELLLSI